MLRYASPLLHLVALATNLALLGEGTIYVVTLVAQLGLAAAALIGGVVPLRPLRIARYYVAVTAASAVGLWDVLRHGVPRDLGEGRGNPVSEPRRGLPRAADIVIAAPGPGRCSRPLLVVAAVAIKLDSRGPVIYRQRRAGLRGEALRAAEAADDAPRRRPGRGRAPPSSRTTPG